MHQVGSGSFTHLVVEALQLLHEVVVVAVVSHLVDVHDGVQVREVPVEVHAVVVSPPRQVVPCALGRQGASYTM